MSVRVRLRASSVEVNIGVAIEGLLHLISVLVLFSFFLIFVSYHFKGLISDSDKDAIFKGLKEIENQIERGEFVWRTDREDVHLNIQAALTDFVGEPAKKLYTARSRIDQICIDIRLWCRDAIDAIVSRIKNL